MSLWTFWPLYTFTKTIHILRSKCSTVYLLLNKNIQTYIYKKKNNYIQYMISKTSHHNYLQISKTCKTTSNSEMPTVLGERKAKWTKVDCRISSQFNIVDILSTTLCFHISHSLVNTLVCTLCSSLCVYHCYIHCVLFVRLTVWCSTYRAYY